MTSKLRRGLHQIAEAVAAELGVELLGIDTSAKHPRIRFRLADGREVFATAASTPRSDETSTLNFARQQCRRAINATH